MAELDKRRSAFISETLDDIGYSQKNINFRKRLITRICQYLDKFSPNRLRFILTGSAAEGVSLFYESDYDSIVINNRVSCVNGTAPVTGIIYECETENTPPGYTRLKLLPTIKQDDLHGVNELLNSTFGDLLYNTYYKSKMKTMVSSEYPANLMCGLEKTCKLKKVKMEFPLILHNTNIPEELKNRRRSYGWPSKTVIEQIESSHVTSYVYPTGDVQSDNSNLEWRISHTDVENILMDSLNDTQIKVYLLLKLIVKPALSRDNGVTSYALKNLLFWMCQSLHEDCFQEENLLSLLTYALGMLYNCVKCGHMPCFLMPKRNLFPRLNVETKYVWLHKLKALQEERGRIVLNNDKLRHFMMLKVANLNEHIRCTNEIEKVERLLFMLVKFQVETKASKEAIVHCKAGKSDWEIVKDNIYKTIIPKLSERSDSVSEEDIRKQVDIYLRNLLS